MLFDDLTYTNIIRIKDLPIIPLLNLFYVPNFLVLIALSNSDRTITKIHEHLGTFYAKGEIQPRLKIGFIEKALQRANR
jgi:hypothetical protein